MEPEPAWRDRLITCTWLGTGKNSHRCITTHIHPIILLLQTHFQFYYVDAIFMRRLVMRQEGALWRRVTQIDDEIASEPLWQCHLPGANERCGVLGSYRAYWRSQLTRGQLVLASMTMLPLWSPGAATTRFVSSNRRENGVLPSPCC